MVSNNSTQYSTISFIYINFKYLIVNCPPGNFQTIGERVTLVDGVNVTESLPVCSACGTNQVQPEQGQTSCTTCSARNATSEECLGTHNTCNLHVVHYSLIITVQLNVVLGHFPAPDISRVRHAQ